VSEPHDSPQPTEQSLLLTAWLDGELPAQDRARFERMLADDPTLAAEAAAQRELIDMTRSLATLEPTEAEMRRFWSSFYNRTEWQVAWVLLLLGAVGLVGEGIYLLVTATAFTWVIKIAVLLTLSGASLLVWNTARLKMRTSRFDRYRGVMR
jgi:anti-sigma factor RsiW